MYQRMQNEFDEKVLKILGKKGYNKFADYTFDYKQEISAIEGCCFSKRENKYLQLNCLQYTRLLHQLI